MKKMLYALMIVVIMAGVFVPTAAAEEETTISVIITAAGDVEAVIAEVEALDGTVTHVYENFPMLVAEVTTDAAVTLSGLDIVESVAKNQIRTLDPPIIDETRDGDVLPTSEMLGEDGSLEALTDLSALPEGYYNYDAVGAPQVWYAPDGNAGETTIIAVVDTGIRFDPVFYGAGCLGNRLIMPGYNATGDGVSETSMLNHWHGSHVANVAGANCIIGTTNAAVGEAVKMYRPGNVIEIPPFYNILLQGIAPEAQFYPVKVFPTSGAGVPDSIIIDGLDHILTRKKAPPWHPDHLDIDIVNMSLGGGTLFDGWDSYHVPILKLTMNGILVVTSAGNDGPVPNSIGTPATDFRSLSVGATDDATSTRILREWQGRQFYAMPGWGDTIRPTDETRIVTFSSRGPLSDGRDGPDVVALGYWNFAAYPEGAGLTLRWATGTSFSSPTVAGGAALLNTWWEQNNPPWKERPGKLRNAIMFGADPDVINDPWQARDEGFGYLDVPAAWSLLKADVVPPFFIPFWGHKLYNNVGWDCDDTACVYESDVETVGPAETFDLIFEVHPEIIDEIYIELLDVDGEQNNIFWNTADLWVKSAKRTATPYVVDDLYAVSGDAWVSIRDGEVDLGCDNCGLVGGNFDWAMEPGQWKVTVAGYDTNNAPMSFKLRITKTFRWDPPGEPWQQGMIWTGTSFAFPYDASGLGELTFDLAWGLDWSKFPTNDIDMEVYGPGGFYTAAGATMSAPEKVVIESPADGTYWVVVSGYEISTFIDFFKLYVTAE
jgi:hypothetical protein